MSHQRFNGATVRKDFLPFYGWEEAPLKGLEEAVKNVPVPRISDYAGAAADYADDYLRRNGGTDPLGLTREEIAAVNLYSKQNILHPEKSFYAVMNRTFNERDRKKLVPFFPYLRLIFNAASHSKNACPRTPHTSTRFPQPPSQLAGRNDTTTQNIFSTTEYGIYPIYPRHPA